MVAMRSWLSFSDVEVSLPASACVIVARRKGTLSYLILIAGFMLGLTGNTMPALAEQDGRMTLEEAYQLALKYDAKLNAMRAEHEAAKEGVNMAFARYLPDARLALNQGKATTEAENSFGSSRNSNYDTENYALTIRQPLFNKSVSATHRMSVAESERYAELVKNEELALFVRVAESYLKILLAEENIRYSKIQRQALEVQLEQAKRRYEKKLGTVLDVNQAQADMDLAQAEALAYETELELNRRQLETLTGIYPGQLLALGSRQIAIDLSYLEKADQLIDASVSNNPEILAAKQQILVAEQEIARNRSGHFPTLDLVASRSRTQSDTNVSIGTTYDTTSLMLQLNVPLFSGGYVNASIRQAQALKVQAMEELNLKSREVSTEIRRHVNGVTSGAAKVSAYESAVQSADVAYRAALKAFEKGLNTQAEVLVAQEKMFSAMRSLAESRVEYLLSMVSLKASTGLLAEADISELSQVLN